MTVELVTTLENHKRRIWSICWSPDGKYLASVGSDRFIIIWRKNGQNATTGTNGKNKKENGNAIIFEIDDVIETKHEKSLRHVEFAKDGSFFAVASFDSNWSIYKKTNPNAINGFINKTNSKNDEVKKWELVSILKGHEKEVKCVSIHYMNKYIATCGRDKAIWIHSRENDNTTEKKEKKEEDKTKKEEDKTKKEEINWINKNDASRLNHVYTPSTNYNINGNNYNNSLDYQYDAYLTGHTEDIKFVCWCPLSESTFVSLSYDTTIKIWSKYLENWNCIQTLQKHNSTVWCVAFNSDGSEFASCSDDRTIHIWESKKKKKYNNKMYPFLYKPLFEHFEDKISIETINNSTKKNSKSEVYNGPIEHVGHINKNKKQENKKTVLREDYKKVETSLKNAHNKEEKKLENLKPKNENTSISNSKHIYDLNNVYKSHATKLPIYLQVGIFRFVYKFQQANSVLTEDVNSNENGESQKVLCVDKEVNEKKSKTVERIEEKEKEEEKDMLDKDNLINECIFDDWELKYTIADYHKRGISFLDWNAYENLLAVSSFDNSLKIFEKQSDEWNLIENIENAHISDVNCVMWCPQKHQNSFLLATAGDDCVINIWKFSK